MTLRPCLSPGCPVLSSGASRCPAHHRTTAGKGYGAAWQRHSRAERQRQGACARCGATRDLTLDHATGLVGCRSCHRPDSVGGLMRGRKPDRGA